MVLPTRVKLPYRVKPSIKLPIRVSRLKKGHRFLFLNEIKFSVMSFKEKLKLHITTLEELTEPHVVSWLEKRRKGVWKK